MRNLNPTHLFIATPAGMHIIEISTFLLALLAFVDGLMGEGDCLCPGCAEMNVIDAEFEVVEHDEEPETTRYPRLLLEESEPPTLRLRSADEPCTFDFDTNPNCACETCEQETLAVFDLVPFSWINPSFANTNLLN